MGKHHTEVLLDSFNPEDPNSALVLHLQTAMRSPATSALTIMLAQYLREPAFNELRTRRQLGYIVSTGAGGFGAQHHSMRGITVRVLSQRYGPHEMLTAVDEFLASQAETFAAITQDDLDSRTASVIRTLEDPPTAFSEEASSFWSAIVENQPFDWNELVIAELRALRVETLLRGWTEYIAPGSPTRRSIAIMLESNAHKQIRQSTSTSAAIEAMTLDQLTVLRDSLIFVNSPP
jgi:insulysin